MYEEDQLVAVTTTILHYYTVSLPTMADSKLQVATMVIGCGNDFEVAHLFDSLECIVGSSLAGKQGVRPIHFPQLSVDNYRRRGSSTCSSSEVDLL